MTDHNMPTTYETQTTSRPSSTIGFHPEYLRTIPGILKIIEIVLSIITFICAIVWSPWTPVGGGWVQFVSIVGFIISLALFMLYLVGLFYKLPGPRVIIVLSILCFICAMIHDFPGGGWVRFVAISAFVTTLVYFIAYLVAIIYKLNIRFLFIIAVGAFACTWTLDWPTPRGQSWLQFVSGCCFLFTNFYFFFHLFNVFKPGQALPVVLSLITFICACVSFWQGQGWVEFVAISAFVSTLAYLILHFLNMISRFPGPWLLIEFIYYCIFTVFFLIAAIVAAAKAGFHASIGAAAFFAFAATAVYAVDTFFQFRAWRTGQTEMAATTTTTTTQNPEAGKSVY